MTDNHVIPHADKLSHVTTATLTHLLSQLGQRNSFMEGISPLDPDAKVVGRARTLRFLPARGPVPGGPGTLPTVVDDRIGRPLEIR